MKRQRKICKRLKIASELGEANNEFKGHNIKTINQVNDIIGNCTLQYFAAMLCLPISKKIFTAWSKHDIASTEHPEHKNLG
jgi:hypothetical protein